MDKANWVQLWNDNYRGIGDTKDIVAEKLDFGAESKSKRHGVSYLAWAVAERVFKLQGGTYELLKTKYPLVYDEKGVPIHHSESTVEVDDVVVRVIYNTTTGSFEEQHMRSFFINVKVDWMGQTHIERYPLQDNNGSPLQSWTQNDINKSVQRGKTKAIAIVSGIGYKLYEDGDLQFEPDEKETASKVQTGAKTETPEKIKTTEIKANEQIKEKPVAQSKPKPVETTTQKTETVEQQITPEAQKTVAENVQSSDIEKVEIPDKEKCENKIKQVFMSGNIKKQTLIKNFLVERGKVKVVDLSEQDVRELYTIVVLE